MRRVVEGFAIVVVVLGGAWYATVTAWLYHLNRQPARN